MTFHGYSIREMNEMVASVLNTDGEIQLSTSLLEGWSSVNILGFLDNKPSFVLKLPKSSEINDFERQYKVHLELAKYDICSRPLYMGRLSDSHELPVLILEYVDGHIYESPYEILTEDIEKLKDALAKLARIHLEDVPRYLAAIDYLNAIARPLEFHIYDYGKGLTKGLQSLFDSFIELSDTSRSQLEGCAWNPVTIHGDLFERNVVFQNDRAVLLDMEECCVADSSYDLVYLFVQSYSTGTLSYQHPLRGCCSREHWDSLEILALCSVIKWSLQRLLDLELGLIELNLAQMVSVDLIKVYVDEKMGILSTLLQK